MKLFSTFSNWRTTLLGVAALMAALGDIGTQIAQMDWDATRFGADITGIFTGLGLLFARDSVASERDHVEDRVRISQNQAEIADVQQDVVIAKDTVGVLKENVAAVQATVESKL